MVAVTLPMTARDGDVIVAYLKPESAGWKITDMGTTMMRLSYEMDLNKILTGSRGNLYQALLSESGLNDDDGEIYLLSDAQSLMRNLLGLGKALQGYMILECGLKLVRNLASMMILKKR